MLDWLRRRPDDPDRLLIGERELPVVIRRLTHARRMTMRLAPDGSEVRISMPKWGRTAEALAFARSRADWLARQLEAVPQAPALAQGSLLPFRGEMLFVRHEETASRRVVPGPGELRLGGPAESLAPRLRRWLEREARRLLAEDLVHYCALAGREPPRLALSNARRRWGSCAADGTIRINWRLVMAPDHVRRSVVAHEVAHLVHFDHSREFHALLARLFEGDVAEANQWLKADGRSLYAWFG